MKNSVQVKELVRPEVPEKKILESTAAEPENIVEFATRSQKIAEQSEAACKLSGNPDFDVFEEKYGLTEFA